MHPSRSLSLPILKRSSYYTPDYRQSPALIRARRPYIFKNLITGAAIMTFAIGVFAWTIKAVGQDKFEDVIVPDAPQASQQQGTQPAQTSQIQSGSNVGHGVVQTGKVSARS